MFKKKIPNSVTGIILVLVIGWVCVALYNVATYKPYYPGWNVGLMTKEQGMARTAAQMKKGGKNPFLGTGGPSDPLVQKKK